MVNLRDEFKERTRRLLEDRVRSCCSNPDCRCPTSGPGSFEDSVKRVGCASHITAASLGGPRYNRNLSSEERRSAQNGIWLCCNCHVLVDSDPIAYPVDLLVQWKAYSEYLCNCELEGAVNLHEEGDLCGYCGTLVQTGMRVCTGCSAETIIGSTRNEWRADFSQSACLSGLSVFMLLGVPSLVNLNTGTSIPEYWGLSVLAVLPLSAATAFVIGYLWSFREDNRRAKSGVRFLRYMQS